MQLTAHHNLTSSFLARTIRFRDVTARPNPYCPYATGMPHHRYWGVYPITSERLSP